MRALAGSGRSGALGLAELVRRGHVTPTGSRRETRIPGYGLELASPYAPHDPS